MAEAMRFAASNVQRGVIPDSGHWVMEENPNATLTMVGAFYMAGLSGFVLSCICSGPLVRREPKLDMLSLRLRSSDVTRSRPHGLR